MAEHWLPRVALLVLALTATARGEESGQLDVAKGAQPSSPISPAAVQPPGTASGTVQPAKAESEPSKTDQVASNKPTTSATAATTPQPPTSPTAPAVPAHAQGNTAAANTAPVPAQPGPKETIPAAHAAPAPKHHHKKKSHKRKKKRKNAFKAFLRTLHKAVHGAERTAKKGLRLIAKAAKAELKVVEKCAGKLVAKLPRNAAHTLLGCLPHAAGGPEAYASCVASKAAGAAGEAAKKIAACIAG